MRIGRKEILGLLVDLDGVLYVDHTPIPGAIETVKRWAAAVQPRCYLTNTTTQSSATLGKKIRQMGFSIDAHEVLSAPEAAKLYLEKLGRPVCKLVLDNDVLAEFGDFPQSDTDAKVVILGDVGDAWSYDLLNNVFRLLMSGAELIALQRNKFW